MLPPVRLRPAPPLCSVLPRTLLLGASVNKGIEEGAGRSSLGPCLAAQVLGEQRDEPLHCRPAQRRAIVPLLDQLNLVEDDEVREVAGVIRLHTARSLGALASG